MVKNVFNIVKWVLICLMGVFFIVLLENNHELRATFELFKSNGLHVNYVQYRKIDTHTKINKSLYVSANRFAKNSKVLVTYKYKDKSDGNVTYLNRVLPSVESIAISTTPLTASSIIPNIDTSISVLPVKGSVTLSPVKDIYYANLDTR